MSYLVIRLVLFVTLLHQIKISEKVKIEKTIISVFLDLQQNNLLVLLFENSNNANYMLVLNT